MQEAGATHALLRGRLLIALAAILWSSSGLFAKAPIFDDWPVESRGTLLAFWRALFAGALLLPAVRRPRWGMRLLPLCGTFAVMNVCYLSALTLTTAANAIWLQSTAPWWVFLAGAVSGRERLPRAELLPLVVGGIGLAIILWFELGGQAGAGVALGLISGACYAGVVLALRSLKADDSVWLVVVAHLFTALVIFPYVVWMNIWPSGWQLPILAAFGFVQMAIPYVCFARGLQSVRAQEATFIVLLEPLLMPFWVWLAWGEVPASWTFVGGGLILAGLALRYSPLFSEGQVQS